MSLDAWSPCLFGLAVVDLLAERQQVILAGLGRFEVRSKPARTVTAPGSGSELLIPERRFPAFRPERRPPSQSDEDAMVHQLLQRHPGGSPAEATRFLADSVARIQKGWPESVSVDALGVFYPREGRMFWRPGPHVYAGLGIVHKTASSGLDTARALQARLMSAGMSTEGCRALLQAARWALGLQTTPLAYDAETLVGRSRVGGDPDLLSPERWPHNAEGPLSFLAQIRLEELPKSIALPRAGLLSFFVSPAGPCAREGQIIFCRDPERARPTLPPIGADSLSQAAIGFTPFISLPSCRDDMPEGAQAYWFDGLFELCHGSGHQLLGYPHRYDRDLPGSRLLLQLSSDLHTELQWGGGQGTFGLFVPESHLKRARFDECQIRQVS